MIAERFDFTRPAGGGNTWARALADDGANLGCSWLTMFRIDFYNPPFRSAGLQSYLE
jgi:hypothetical protein